MRRFVKKSSNFRTILNRQKWQKRQKCYLSTFALDCLTRAANLKLMTKLKFPKSILRHSMLDNQLYLSFLINSILFYWSSRRIRFCKCLKDSLFTCWLRFSCIFNIWQTWWVVHVKMFESISSQSKISSRFGKFRDAFLSACWLMLSERSSFVTY